MKKYRFITRSDCHLSDRPPVSRIDDYKEAILNKLDQIYKLAVDHECDAILDAGDFYHVKAPTKNSHELTGDVALLHNQYKVPVYAIIGNHDVMYSNVDTIDKQPLGVLFKTKTFNRLQDITIGDVRIIGIDYRVDVDEELLSRCKKGDEKILIAVFHGSVADLPLYPGEKFYSYKKLAELDPDIWVLGHIHKDQGIQEVEGKHFINLGAISRGALTYDDITRTPRVGFIEITVDDGDVNVQVTPIDLLVREAKEIFDFERKEKVQQETRKIEDFIENLIKVSTEDPKDKLTQSISSLGLAQEVKDTIYHYLEAAENA